MALAAAWTLPAGEGQLIVTGSFATASRGYDADGSRIDIADYEKGEVNALLEYGLTDDLTVILEPQIQHITIGPPTEARRFGPGYTDVGLRHRLWSEPHAVLSAQLTARLPGTRNEGNPAAIGYTDSQLDLRLLYGRSFHLGNYPAFLDTQLAYRLRFEAPADEIRLDVTVGMFPHPRLLLLAQSFNVMADTTFGGVLENARYHKLQLSGVWAINEVWSLQIGGLATVAGADALQEKGLVVALWRRF